ncbi:MAG TPA: histidine--tRNA ligase [Chthonomonadaceae bacterium]|nr:histidine--tRNA ligase [Chthonomonadaceae bacterium]
MPYTAPPYMYDVLPYPPAKEPWLHSARWRYVEGVFREVCRRFGYREIRTPVMEQTELFTRHIGEATDIVSKEMFTFTDRGDRSMTLKPEGTAPAVRACIEHKLFAEHPVLKLYYVGQNFRYERGQKGRYRQHQQLGIEVFGSSDPAVDAEVILLAMEHYRMLGVTEQQLKINSVGTPTSRPAYREALRDFVRPFLSEMSAEGQHRFEVNPLRMLDTKDANDLRLLEGAPRLVDYLDPESREHFEKLQAYLSAASVPYEVDHRLVRGFDYYTKTAFEITGGQLGAQNTLVGGGRYDGLVEECGGPSVPGIGFGMGMERCLLTLEGLGIELPLADERPLAFIVTLGDEAKVRPAAVQLLMQIRAAGFAADIDYKGRKFGQQAKRADDLGARFLLVLGDGELERGVIGLRDQATKEQREVPISDLFTELTQLAG